MTTEAPSAQMDIAIVAGAIAAGGAIVVLIIIIIIAVRQSRSLQLLFCIRISYIGYRENQPRCISGVLQEYHQDLQHDHFLPCLMARMTSLRVGSSFEMIEATLADVDSFDLREQSKEVVND